MIGRDWFFAPLRPLFYEMIVIDPPWGFELYSDEGAEKSAAAHYVTLSDADILAMPVGELASINCLLYCWATAPQLPLAIEAVKRWGFTYQSFMCWRKISAGGKVMMGTGYRVRSTGELLLVATLGNPKQARVPQTIFDGVRREHSRKPEAFYALCDRVMPHARRADVFAREPRAGWDSFGDQVEHFTLPADQRMPGRRFVANSKPVIESFRQPRLL